LRRIFASGNLPGIGFMVVSSVCMAGMYTSIRLVPRGMHPFEIVFFRNLIGLLMLLAWHAPGGLRVLKTTRLRMHALRGVLNVAAMLTFFYAVTITPLAEVAALSFTGPLFASLLALLFLKEPPRLHRLGVMAFGFAGALVIVRPGLSVVQAGAVLLLVSSAIWAFALIVIKMLARTESSATITLYMVSFMTPLSLITAVSVWRWPDLHQVFWFLVVSLFGTAGQLCLAQAFRMADSTAVLPLDFLKLIWGSALGYLVFAEIPDVWVWAGGTMIFASTTYLALRETR
jgi:drug/metabolite transporter (DMT)-like permease